MSPIAPAGVGPAPSVGLGDVVRRSWAENRLFSVLVELTYRCNLDCFFCYNDLGLVGRPLSAAQWEAFFRDLAAMGVPYLVLSGGEPMAHPDFYRLGAAARELGFVVRIKSNGHALGAAAARRIKEEIDPYMVETSLHGARPETHDRQTRVPGSFARLIENLGHMKAAGLRLKINSTLTAWNEGEIEAMYDLADRLEVPLQFDPDVTPRDNGDLGPLAVSPSREGLRRLLALDAARAAAFGTTAARAAAMPATAARAAAMPATAARAAAAQGTAAQGDAEPGSSSGAGVLRQGDAEPGLAPGTSTTKHCGAGSSGIAVDPYGNVYPCVQWRRPAGNLHQAPIGEIWASSPALAAVRRLTGEIKTRLADEFGDDAPLLSFCPGNAESLGGDPATVGEGPRRRLDLMREGRPVAAGGRSRLPVLPG